MRRAARARVALFALLAALAPVPAQGQTEPPPQRGGLTYSIGLPPRVERHVFLDLGQHRRDETFGTAYAGAGVRRDLSNPVSNLAAAQAELYMGVRAGEQPDGGVRLAFHSPFLRFKAGVDYNFRDRHGDLILGVVHPLQRGGIFFPGGQFRVSYLPGRGHSFSLGIQAPTGERTSGRSRPVQDAVRIRPPIGRVVPRAPGTDSLLAPDVARVAVLAERVQTLTLPFLDHDASSDERALERVAGALDRIRALLDTGGPDGGPLSVEGHILAYHDALDLLFSRALEPAATAATPAGRHWADVARKVLLDEVLVPHDALLGQNRAPETLVPFQARAQAVFGARVTADATLTDAQSDALQWSLQAVGEAVERLRGAEARRWGGARRVWLALQLALRPEQHRTRAQIDALIEQATGARFTDDNEISYFYDAQFQQKLHDSIEAAEDFHVLWVHDVRGRNARGEPDAATFQLVQTYLGTLIRRIRDYDRDGILPVFIILLDQWYYEVNGGRLWLEFLADPLGRLPNLERRFAAWEARLDSLGRALREAMAASERLQAEARAYGVEWLHNRLKVHVNITHPPDPTFLSFEVLPVFGIPDNLYRDHRKVVFWDLTEADPFRGAALFTGMGVGEQYVAPAWEDRGVRLRGPAAIGLKAAARDLLRFNGVPDDRIPWHLRPVEAAAGAAPPALNPPWGPATAMQLHNDVGFGPKPINVAKAMLYTLLPCGAVAKIPDSLWNNPVWASMLLGHALRGGHVLLIAPTLETAPSRGAPAMSRAYELLARMVLAQDRLAPALGRAGGGLRVGLYDPGAGRTDMAARIETWLERTTAEPWLQALFAVDPAVGDSLRAVAATLRREGGPVPATSSKLHTKSHFFASAEGWRRVTGSPDLAAALAAYVRARAAAGRAVDAAADSAFEHGMRAFSAGVLRPRASPAEGDAAYYLLVGSHNQALRSMLLDGEVQVVVSGHGAVVGLFDFILMPGLTRWVTNLDELRALLPRPGELMRRLARFIQFAL
jgi:hypothetical protein